MTKQPLVLIVDDEEPIRSFLSTSLRARGFGCEEVGSGEGALLLAASLQPEVILLDLGLPDLDGTEVVRRVRGTSTTPIVVISARDQEQDKVEALNAGADDYLTKPFGVEELVARLRVALRHRSPELGAALGPRRWGELRWTPETQQVFWGTEEVRLTPLEYRLFAYMAQNPGRILTHGVLLKEVWGLSNLELSHYVRIAVASVRKKIEPRSGTARFIRTEVGIGYRFAAQGSGIEDLPPG